MCNVITPDDLHRICILLIKDIAVVANREMFFLALKLPDDELRDLIVQIQLRNQGTYIFLHETLSKWVSRSDEEPTWKKFIGVLRNVGFIKSADRLKLEYINCYGPIENWEDDSLVYIRVDPARAKDFISTHLNYLCEQTIMNSFILRRCVEQNIITMEECSNIQKEASTIRVGNKKVYKILLESLKRDNSNLDKFLLILKEEDITEEEQPAGVLNYLGQVITGCQIH